MGSYQVVCLSFVWWSQFAFGSSYPMEVPDSERSVLEDSDTRRSVIEKNMKGKPSLSHRTTTAAKKKKLKKVGTTANMAVAQAMGSLGNAWMVDDCVYAPERILVYRLVNFTNGRWGDGLLPELERKNSDDAALNTALVTLLDQPWRSCPIRQGVVREMGPINGHMHGWSALRKLLAQRILLRALHSRNDT